MLTVFKKYPALSWTTISGFVTSVLAVWATANSTGVTNWSLLALGLAPIVAGALVHVAVMPVDKIRAIVIGARTATAAVNKLADAVDLAISDTPNGAQ